MNVFFWWRNKQKIDFMIMVKRNKGYHMYISKGNYVLLRKIHFLELSSTRLLDIWLHKSKEYFIWASHVIACCEACSSVIFFVRSWKIFSHLQYEHKIIHLSLNTKSNYIDTSVRTLIIFMWFNHQFIWLLIF